MRNRFGVPTELDQGYAQKLTSLYGIGRSGNYRSKNLGRLLEYPRTMMSYSKIEQKRCEAGRQLQGPFVSLDRFLILAKPRKYTAEIRERFNVIRFLSYCDSVLGG